MVRIALDAMGGDHAPAEIVAGALAAARRFSDIQITLVGPRDHILPLLPDPLPTGLRLHHTTAWVDMNDRPVQAVRTRPDASINVACRLVKEGRADVVVTMGHTGAAFVAARFTFGLIPGIERPAVAVPYFALHPRMVLVDVGANADVRPRHLLQFAQMGAAYAEHVLGIPRPRVGLLTLGTEPRKGPLEVQDAYDLLEASDLNFVGCIEGLDVAHGRVDVVVHSGFVGNIVLKLTEGLVEELLTRAAERAAAVAGERADAVRAAIRDLQEQNSYARIGAGALLGVDGLMFIGHGRSRADAVVAGIATARRAVQADFLARVHAAVAAPHTLG